MAAGHTSLYLSSRTAWLVPLGAVLASAGALGRLASARVRDPETLGSRETWAIGIIVLPVVLLLTLPPTTLDSYAVSRRSNSTGIGSSARIVSGPSTSSTWRLRAPSRTPRRPSRRGRASGSRSKDS